MFERIALMFCRILYRDKEGTSLIIQNYDITLWKTELELQKVRNDARLKEIESHLTTLLGRLELLLDIKEKLVSKMIQDLEVEIASLKEEKVELEKKNMDIKTIMFEINIEQGKVLICD